MVVRNSQWIVIALLLLLIPGCSLEKQYHSNGYNINSIGLGSIKRSGGSSVSATSSGRLSITSERGTRTTGSRGRWLDSTANPTDESFQEVYQQMDVPMEWLKEYATERKVYPFFRHDSIVRSHKMVTVRLSDKMLFGKLMAVSESGVFLYNNRKPLSVFENFQSNVDQKEFFGKLSYIPYSDVVDIQRGTTFSDKMQRILEPFFQWVSLLVVAFLSVLTMIGVARGNNGGSSLGDGFEILLAIFLVIGMVIAALFCVVLAIVLAPPVWIYHNLLKLIPGRKWVIGRDMFKGEKFFRAMIKSPRKLNIYRK